MISIIGNAMRKRDEKKKRRRRNANVKRNSEVARRMGMQKVSSARPVNAMHKSWRLVSVAKASTKGLQLPVLSRFRVLVALAEDILQWERPAIHKLRIQAILRRHIPQDTTVFLRMPRDIAPILDFLTSIGSLEI
jgi:hypothetical protein